MAGDVQAPNQDATAASAPAPAAAPASQQPQKDAPSHGPATGEKKLSGAELKAKAKAEKAARRAASKAVTQPADSGKGGKSRQRQDGPPALSHKGKYGGGPQAPVKEKAPAVPECFSHLGMAKRVTLTQADKDVHPAVLVLGQQMSSFVVTDSIRRLEATLLALKKACLTRLSGHTAQY